MKEPMLTPVEKHVLNSSPYADIYSPTEKMRAIIVDNFPALGKLAAMRFIEWIQCNPGGVVSLPTGKTPEHFIRWVTPNCCTSSIRDVRGGSCDAFWLSCINNSQLRGWCETLS